MMIIFFLVGIRSPDRPPSKKCGGWWVVSGGSWVVGGAKFVLSLKTDFKSADDQTFFENFKFEKFCKIPYLCKHTFF